MSDSFETRRADFLTFDEHPLTNMPTAFTKQFFLFAASDPLPRRNRHFVQQKSMCNRVSVKCRLYSVDWGEMQTEDFRQGVNSRLKTADKG